MALTDDQIGEVFRYLRYPYPGTAHVNTSPPFSASLGTGASILGFPTDPHVRGLAYRLNNLDPAGELRVVGADHPLFDVYCGFASAQFVIAPFTAAAGLSAMLQIGPSAIPYATIVSDDNAKVAAALTQLVNADPTVSGFAFAQAVSNKVVVTARQYGRDANAISLNAFCTGLTVTVTSDGTTPARRMSGGKNPPGPRFINPDVTPPMPIYGHLPIIKYWEDQIGISADNMDTVKAGDYVAERTEYPKRRAAFFNACRDLAQDLGVQFGGAGSFDGRQPPMRST